MAKKRSKSPQNGKNTAVNGEKDDSKAKLTGRERSLANLAPPFTGKDDPRVKKAGRPKGSRSVGSVLREGLSKELTREQLTKILNQLPKAKREALKSVLPRGKVRVVDVIKWRLLVLSVADTTLLRELLDRVDGKPMQRIEAEVAFDVEIKPPPGLEKDPLPVLDIDVEDDDVR